VSSLHNEFALPTCAPWCEAVHIEPGVTDDHWTGLGGTLGDHVIVNQAEGGSPMVRLVELPQNAEFTPAAVRLLAMRMWMAADFADRAAQPDVADLVARAVAEALAARAQDSAAQRPDERRPRQCDAADPPLLVPASWRGHSVYVDRGDGSPIEPLPAVGVDRRPATEAGVAA